MDYWKNAWNKSFEKRSYRITLHVIFWILYAVAMSFLSWKGRGSVLFWSINLLISIAIAIPIYYLTIRTTYQFLIQKHKYGLFWGTLFINIILFGLLVYGSRELIEFILPKVEISNRPDRYSTDLGRAIWTVGNIFLNYFIVLGMPVFAKFFRDQLRHQRRENALQKQNLQLQMDFLKAQIHPHFLFNTLNNIYSLNMDTETKKASKMISRLSSLLRYVLYKGKTEFIALTSEVEMLQDFIKLEAIRSDNLDLTLDIPQQTDEKIHLPPFLLLPLVENAFKHGLNSQLSRSFIKISLSVNQKHILLEVTNNFDEEYRETNSEGLGLANLRKRLKYYYPESYTLSTSEQDDQFKATLKIPLQCPKYNA